MGYYYFLSFIIVDGWCQDVIDAAMLGLSEDAALQVLGRALEPPASGWRFRLCTPLFAMMGNMKCW